MEPWLPWLLFSEDSTVQVLIMANFKSDIDSFYWVLTFKKVTNQLEKQILLGSGNLRVYIKQDIELTFLLCNYNLINYPKYIL